VGGSGVLAVGGPFFQTSTFNFKGQQYHQIVEGDVVVQNGIGCVLKTGSFTGNRR
jgi:hypothetical protein